jgi:hypothetical protein
LNVWENEEELSRLEDVIRFLGQHRTDEKPMDIVIMGVTEDAKSKEGINLVKQRADLGATWWLESLTPFRAGKGYEDEWPVEAMRDRILDGPPQLN